MIEPVPNTRYLVREVRACMVEGCERDDSGQNMDYAICGPHWVQFHDESESYAHYTERLRNWIKKRRLKAIAP